MSNTAATAFSGETAIAQPAATTVAAPAAPVAPAANADSWTSSIQNEPLRSWATAKGWKDPGAVVESAYNLEKLIGHDRAGRTLVVPGENATPEELKAFHSKLGVPESADGYLPHIKVPEGGDPEFAKQAASWFHKNGIPPKQAEGLVAEWNAYAESAHKQMTEQSIQESEKAFAETVAKWGKDAEANLELGKRAAMQFIPAKDSQERQQIMSKIEQAIGTTRMLELFSSIGKNMGEGRLVSNGQSGGGNTSVAEAQAKRTQYMNDPNWRSDYATNKNKQQEMWQLNQIIAGAQGGN